MEDRLLKISYTMTLEEISEGFKLFWRKYQLKRAILFTIVYVIALVLGVDFIIKGAGNFYGYVLVGLALGLTFMCWYRPVHVRKKLLATISSLAQETYISEFFSDRIQITTQIFTEEATEEAAEEKTETKSDMAAEEVCEGKSEEADAEPTENVVTNLYFGSELMDALENEEMFLLFVNKSLIYIYPKRCLEDDEQESLRKILTEKAILA